VVATSGISVTDWSEAVVFTPGGGKVGGLLGETIDARLAEHAGRGDHGRLVTLEITAVDAALTGSEHTGTVTCLLVPAHLIPTPTWDLAASKRPIRLVATVGDGIVTAMSLDDPGEVTEDGSTVEDDRVISTFIPVPQLVVIGDHPVSVPLTGLAELLGWRAQVFTTAGAATGVIATLSDIDMVVVAAHDLELAGAALLAALDSDAGYIGSLGARRMQENRADWLAYRGVTDLSRVHGPAGLDIGAGTPGEIAVSIAAEAIASRAVERGDG
jgi:xanthine dehydrogenase accessory factor